MTEKELDYVETIMDLLNQACYVEDKNDPTASVVDHQCMSSYEHATALLEELGFAKETSLGSRTYYLFPKKIEEARHFAQQTQAGSPDGSPKPCACNNSLCQKNKGTHVVDGYCKENLFNCSLRTASAC